jgi:hypothetical protein
VIRELEFGTGISRKVCKLADVSVYLIYPTALIFDNDNVNSWLSILLDEDFEYGKCGWNN